MKTSSLVAALAVTVLAGSMASAATNVAVFNFQMTSETPEWKWLEKGLADRIATDFVQDTGLDVVARDRMQMLAAEMRWVPEMATSDPDRMGKVKKALKIEYLVTGVYRVTADGGIHLTGQIVEVDSRKEVARKEVEGKAAEVLALQRRLSAELLAWFSKRTPAEILQRLPVWTRSLPAARALYEGMDLYDQGRYAEGWLKFRQASREDPQYVEAVYWTGKMYYFLHRYGHARRMLERFVYLDTAHPRLGDAMVEYVHTYEASGASGEDLLALYGRLAQRFPNARVWQGREWGHFGDLRSDAWFGYKRMHLLHQLGRDQEVIDMFGPVLNTYQCTPEIARDCRYPYGLVSLMDHYARTGRMARFEIISPRRVIGNVGERLLVKEGTNTWLRFEADGRGLMVEFQPRRLVGGPRPGDREAAFDLPAGLATLGLRAPTGCTFKSLEFRSVTEGTDGHLAVRFRRPDTVQRQIGFGPPTRVTLSEARTKGLHIDAPPLAGIVVAECRFEVAPTGGPVVVKAVGVKAELAPLRSVGCLDVDCAETADFRVYVDGCPVRWHPGLVGPLTPGKHTLQLVPAVGGAPFGQWSREVTVEAGETVRVQGRLPFADAALWDGWTATLLGTPYPPFEPSLWGRERDDTPGIQADDEAIRVVWSRRGDLWAAVSTDGDTFTPPQRIDLPVSSGWNEYAPRLVRDEDGRFVLVFLSGRDAQHRQVPYACWSRDFRHWSNPAVIRDEGFYADYGLFRDARGRLLLDYQDPDGHGALVSPDGFRWTDHRIPGKVLLQSGSGRYESFRITQKKDGQDGPQEGKGKLPSYRVRLLRWTSADLEAWSSEQEVGAFRLKAPFPSARWWVLCGKEGPVLFGFDRWTRWGLGLCEPDASGTWKATGRLWGLLSGPAVPAWHPKWGYLIACVSRAGETQWPRTDCGPRLFRGPTLDPLRTYENSLPPIAFRDGAPEPVKPTVTQVSGGQRGNPIGKVFSPAHHQKVPEVPEGPVGRLTYVPAFRGRAAFVKGREHFRPAPAGCGTVHPQARIVTLEVEGGKVALAFDAEDASAVHFDVVRVDPTGKGDFRNTPAVRRNRLAPVNRPEKGYEYQFAGDPATFQIDGEPRDAGVLVTYHEAGTLGDGRAVRLILGTCAVGTCRFGDDVYKVRLYDRTNNLSVRDPMTFRREDGKLLRDCRGDLIHVDVYEDGNEVTWVSNVRGDPIRYAGRVWRVNDVRVPQGTYGGPVLVDGRWWHLRVSDDGREISAEPYDGPMAEVRVGHPFWRMCLEIGRAHV